MMTAICAVEIILGAHHNLWAINTEPDYQEEKMEETAPQRPAYAEPLRVGARSTPGDGQQPCAPIAAGEDM